MQKLVGVRGDTRIGRAQVVVAERCPGTLDESILHPPAWAFVRSEAPAEPGHPYLEGTVERDRLEERRAVAGVHQKAPSVDVDRDGLMHTEGVARADPTQDVPRV